MKSRLPDGRSFFRLVSLGHGTAIITAFHPQRKEFRQNAKQQAAFVTGQVHIPQIFNKLCDENTHEMMSAAKLIGSACTIALQFHSCSYQKGISKHAVFCQNLPNKTMAGDAAHIAPCTGCLEGCVGHIFTPDPNVKVTCIINPFCGREGELVLRPAETAKKVVIVGGGPAGLEAIKAFLKERYKQYGVREITNSMVKEHHFFQGCDRHKYEKETVKNGMNHV